MIASAVSRSAPIIEIDAGPDGDDDRMIDLTEHVDSPPPAGATDAADTTTNTDRQLKTCQAGHQYRSESCLDCETALQTVRNWAAVRLSDPRSVLVIRALLLGVLCLCV